MITSMTKKLETELLWTEEELTKKKKMKNEGAGLLILGVGALFMGALNHFVLRVLYGSDMMWVVVTALCALLGIALCVVGVKLMGKTGDSIAEMTAKDSGYSEAEILECYREFRHPDTLVLSLVPQPSQEKDFDKAGFLTRNWLRLPDRLYRGVMRVRDVAVIWYETTALPGYDPGIFVVKSDGTQLYVKCPSDVGADMVEAIAGRNEQVILMRGFAFDGKEYDAFQKPQEAANVYRMLAVSKS